MDTWVWWLVAAVVLAGVEVLTLDLVFAMFAVGALAATGVVAASGSDPAGAMVGLAVAVAGLVLLRPVALRHLHQTPELRTGPAALVGTEALVLAEVGPHNGRVKLAGEVWSARCYDGQSVYPVGEGVQVLSIDGATALVG